jgi:DNA end-binding protein Ku
VKCAVARALWSGAISFGLVNVPVKLYKATPSSSAHGISFNRLHGTCGTRIAHVRRCPSCEIDVPWEDVVNGYEFASGRYAIIRTEELDATRAGAGEEAAIALEDFVDAAEVDPILVDHAYWIAPDGPAKPYALLHRALTETGKVAVARVMIRTRTHLALVRPVGDHLVLSTMFFADEIVAEEEVPAGAGAAKLTERELELARELVERMSAPFEHARYKDETTARMRQLIEEKIAKQEVAAPARIELGEAEVVDIMDALRRSLERTSVRRAEEATTDNAHHGDRDRARPSRRGAREGRGRVAGAAPRPVRKTS